MEKRVIFLNITEYNNTTDEQNFFFHIYCGVLSTISIIPNLISIIIFCCQKEKMKLQQRIQLLLCITFIGIEIRFIPVHLTQKYYFFQAGASFSFIIIATYYQMIYSFIAYKLFVAPDDLSKKCDKFFIYIFPFILFFFLSLFVNLHSNLTLYFNFIAYPENPEPGPKHQLSKRVSHIFRITFFFVNIIYIIKLLRKIKEIIKIEKSKNSFTNKKFNFYLKKLIWYIIGMAIVMNPFLFRYLVEKINNFSRGDALHSFSFSIYFHGFECLSGLIYWFIYIYNINLLRRFFIIFCNKKEIDYLDEFNIEKKINEESLHSILTQSTFTTTSSIENFTGEKNDIELAKCKLEDSKEKSSFISGDENL